MTISTAESCTGGIVSALLTGPPGASKAFIGGICCYSEKVKVDLLGIAPSLIAKNGVVSRETAIAMAGGVRKKLTSSVGLSTTGVAGPGGADSKNPIGTVWCAIKTPKLTHAYRLELSGTRQSIRMQASFHLILSTYKLLKGGDQ